MLSKIFALKFILLGLSSSLFSRGLVDALTRIGACGVTVPAREVLFTVVQPPQRCKAKNVIDTVVLRGFDAASSKLYAGIGQFYIGSYNHSMANVACYCGLGRGRTHSRPRPAEGESHNL